VLSATAYNATVGSAILFPLYLLPQGKVPHDGADICVDPIRATEPAKR